MTKARHMSAAALVTLAVGLALVASCGGTSPQSAAVTVTAAVPAPPASE